MINSGSTEDNQLSIKTLHAHRMSDLGDLIRARFLFLGSIQGAEVPGYRMECELTSRQDGSVHVGLYHIQLQGVPQVGWETTG